MADDVSWMLEMQVQAGREGDLAALMAEMAAATERNEPGTLAYEWSLSADGRVCHLWERYADSAAAMVHARTFGERFAARFFAILTPVRLVLYGSPDETVRDALRAFNPVFMRRAAGFTR